MTQPRNTCTKYMLLYLQLVCHVRLHAISCWRLRLLVWLCSSLSCPH